jgi:peptidoglycan lytic transglycosylase B
MRALRRLALSLAACLLCAGAPQAIGGAQDPAAPPPPPFDEWLAALRVEARSRGISDATLDLALAGLEPDPAVLEKDRSQPETTQTLDAYIAARLSAKTRDNAQSTARQYARLLRRVQTAYGIPAPMVVAVWGLESNFGKVAGSRSAVASLATLAYDARRPTLFRAELFQALTILDRGLLPLEQLKGSWAGAMGQPQFMPSSYLEYAVDFDGDGRKDIWTSEADVLASMANYLKAAGWTPGERWGREVKVSEAVLARIDTDVPARQSGCRARRELTEERTLPEWRALGVRLVSGAPLPSSTLKAAFLRGAHRYFLVYRNYERLLDYNCSNAYAVSVGLLSDLVIVPR